MRYAPKKFTIVVPEDIWPLACAVVAARGPEGGGMFCVKLVDADGNVYYACSAGGWLDDADTYERFRDPWSLWEYLQTFNESPLPFEPDDVVDMIAAASVTAHNNNEVVTDAFFGTIGMTIIGLVQPPA